MYVEEVRRLVGVIVHPVHRCAECQYVLVQKPLLVVIEVGSLGGLDNLHLAPRAQFLHMDSPLLFMSWCSIIFRSFRGSGLYC